MTTKADFNAEDWSTVVDGPLYAGLRVIAAHRGGTLRESLAMGHVYQDARAQSNAFVRLMIPANRQLIGGENRKGR